MTTRPAPFRARITPGLLGVAFLLPGCGVAPDAAEPAPPPGAEAPADAPVAPGALDAPEAGGLVLRAPRAATPTDAVRASYVRARQAEAGAEHRVVETALGLEARNDAHDLALRFEEAGVVLQEALTEEDEEPWQSALRFAGIGRQGGARELPAVERVEGSVARVDYTRPGIREWYVNGPLGLEQGFTLDAAPEGTGHVELAVAVDGGLEPTFSPEHGIVELRDAGGTVVLAVSDLYVADSTGRALPAAFAVDGEEILLRFDDSGAVYPVEIDPLVATPQTTVIASDHQVQSFFGFSIAVSGSRAVVGAPLQDAGTGAAYVFVRASNGTWSEEAKLVPPSHGDPTRTFGFSVSISGSSVAVGAPQSRDTTEGRAYVFTRSGSTWSRQATLTGSDGVSDGNDRFGSSVAIDGNTLCVGAPDGDYGPLVDDGRVTCFTRSGSTWGGRQTLEYGSLPWDLGASLALMGDTVVAGDPSGSSADIGGRAGAGRVWVFQRGADGFFDQTGTFASPSPVVGGGFGSTVELAEVASSTTGSVIVGEPGANSSRGEASGAAQVFRRSGSSRFTHERTLVPSTAVADSKVRAVGLATNALTGRLSAAVGSAFATSVTLFERSSGGSWSESSSTRARPFSMDLDPATLALGFPSEPFIGNAASFLSVKRANGDSCSSATECGSGFCVDGRCCDTSCGGGATDCQACSTAAGGTTNGTCTPLTSAAAAARTCRASAGSCDVAETCSPTRTTCPSNGFRSSSTVCRASAGPCDPAERCTGSSASCPDNALSRAGTVCRAASDLCDVAETCNGTSASCPMDAVAPAFTECRPWGSVCDPGDVCDGTSKVCAPVNFCPF